MLIIIKIKNTDKILSNGLITSKEKSITSKCLKCDDWNWCPIFKIKTVNLLNEGSFINNNNQFELSNMNANLCEHIIDSDQHDTCLLSVHCTVQNLKDGFMQLTFWFEYIFIFVLKLQLCWMLLQRKKYAIDLINVKPCYTRIAL